LSNLRRIANPPASWGGQSLAAAGFLEGNWRADVLFELQQAVDSYHFAHRQM
jgi:hypothetical protein